MATMVENDNAQDDSQLLKALEQLKSSRVPPKDYFRRFLELALIRLGAIEGEAWALSQQGLLATICQVGGGESSLKDEAEQRSRLQRVQRALHSGQPAVCGPTDDDQTRREVSLLAPLQHSGHCIGVLEVALAPETTIDTARSRLETLCELTRHASAYMAQLHDDKPTLEQFEFLRQLDQFALHIHAQPTLAAVARTAANEARLLIGCDRVSVAVRKGRRAEIVAISGEERIVSRSNLTRAMTQLSTETQNAGRAIRYEGSLEGLPPQVEKPLLDYLAESGAQRLVCIPLTPPATTTGPEDGATPAETEVVGALLLEHLGDRAGVSSERQIAQVSAHVAQALASVSEREQVFLLSLRKRIGKTLSWAIGDGWRKCLIAGTLVSVLFFVCALVPAPYRVKAQGKLLPAIQRRVYAPQDGEVVEVFVRDGQQIEAQQPILLMRNDELAIRTLTVRNELHEKQQLRSALEAQESETRRVSTPADQIRLRGRITQTGIEIESLQQQLKELQGQQARLVIRADVRGVVATFRPQEMLAGRPVKQGQMLIEIVDPNGPWQLELDVPANGLGRILSAQKDRGRNDLPVKFVLATSPERTCHGRLSRLATRTNLNENGAAAVEVIATVESVGRPTVGAEVIARIECGRTNLAYAVFGELVESVRRHAW